MKPVDIRKTVRERHDKTRANMKDVSTSASKHTKTKYIKKLHLLALWDSAEPITHMIV